jgi:hypothetical protein
MNSTAFASSLLAVAALLGASSAHAALYWTNWVSEEGGGPVTYCANWDESAVGLGCSGNYCDNVRLLCETLPNGMALNPATDSYSKWFSEEEFQEDYVVINGVDWYNHFGDNFHVCQYPGAKPGVVAGIHCSGRYCDNVQLECVQPAKHDGSSFVPAGATSCAWSAWYSEEQGSVDFGANRYITGVECSGSFCDNKRFYVCTLVAPF